MNIKILVVQLEAIKGDIDKNISKIRNLLLESKFLSADLIVLPELWSIGWDCSSFNSSSAVNMPAGPAPIINIFLIVPPLVLPLII